MKLSEFEMFDEPQFLLEQISDDENLDLNLAQQSTKRRVDILMWNFLPMRNDSIVEQSTSLVQTESF